jgi:glycosyltransferase involved in cell wall biosynthesis
MKILFIHPNMPGQYKHMARILAEDPNNTVVFITKPKAVEIPNVIKVEYKVDREVSALSHKYLIPLERAVYIGQEVWRVCNKMKKDGFVPDVIVGHMGWGDGMFLKDVYYDVPILSFMEFFYSAYNSDVNFLDDSGISDDDRARIRLKNPLHLMNLTFSDWGVCPTHFQLGCHPPEFRSKISVLHDGIDTNAAAPNPDLKQLTLPGGVVLKKEDEVITYISRNFEPYRGFPQFMRAAEVILKRRPNAHIIIVGQDGVSYGKEAPRPFKTYREMMLKEVNLPMERFHQIGYLPYDQMVKIMQLSSAHIYLTVPFVLSWSMMESMSAGCTMIVSNTEPVREVVKHEHNALLVDFHNHEEIADAVDRIFADPSRMRHLGVAARETILHRYDLEKVLPLHIQLIQDLAERKFPPPTAQKIIDFDKSYSLDNFYNSDDKVTKVSKLGS